MTSVKRLTAKFIVEELIRRIQNSSAENIIVTDKDICNELIYQNDELTTKFINNEIKKHGYKLSIGLNCVFVSKEK